MLGVNILWFALILMVLVLVHEAGHMVVAKWCGMRVERFSIFFGRPIWSFRRGETEYGIGWLPLGGYAKISGMTRGEEIPPEVEHRAVAEQEAAHAIDSTRKSSITGLASSLAASSVTSRSALARSGASSSISKRLPWRTSRTPAWPSVRAARWMAWP